MAHAKHELMGGKLHVYMRENSSHWQCSAFLSGRNYRKSTKEESLAKAKDFAEDFYLTLKSKQTRGELKAGKTFRQAAEQFLREYEIITEGQRNPLYVAGHKRRLEKHLIPFLAIIPTAFRIDRYAFTGAFRLRCWFWVARRACSMPRKRLR